jgi:peptide-N-glycosidase F-like protein/type IX secretion system substrate protein
MNNLKKIALLSIIIGFVLSPMISHGAEGDTTKIRVHDAVHMDWYGQYLEWGVFPAPGTTYRRINLDFTIGCPPTGCSDWDYTVLIEALHNTGEIDSTLILAPLYTVDGQSPDTIFSNLNPVYVTFFDSVALGTDSTIANQVWIMTHNDPQDPFAVTDSDYVYPGNFYNYYYNPNGIIIDSVLVGYDQSWVNVYTNTYNVFEVFERQELARVITPYGAFYNNTWKNTWHFDITDLAPLLNDSVEIRAFYSGWSDGFAVTLDFEFIEGTPPRTPISVRNVYKGSYAYGKLSNPIENHLIPKTFDIDTNEVMSMLRVIPSGHGAGTQNCAEFCNKFYQVKIDGIQQYQQQVWRNDCGLNPLMNQAGTWIYDRANWCPGEKVLVREHELTLFSNPGNPMIVDLDFQSYTNNSTNNATYILSTQLITYAFINKTLDAAVEEIIAPNNDFNYVRFNPICNNPKIVIRNTGSTPLTALTITYGIKGAPTSTYSWTGNLAFNQYETVQLGSINWNSTTNTPDEFEVIISDPNNSTDMYAYNDTLRSYLDFPQQFPATFVLVVRTNTAYLENNYNIKDDQGNIVYSNPPLQGNTTYIDTLTFAPGCYEFTLNDTGKDGLSFFANNDGNGYARFLNPGAGALKFLQADFGTRISHRFTVGYLLNTPELETNAELNIYPNPASEEFTIDLLMPQKENITIEVSDLNGRIVLRKDYGTTDNLITRLSLGDESPGMYFIRIIGNTTNITRKIIWNK